MGGLEADGGDVEGDLEVLFGDIDGENGDYGGEKVGVIGMGVIGRVGAILTRGGGIALSARGGGMDRGGGCGGLRRGMRMVRERAGGRGTGGSGKRREEC